MRFDWWHRKHYTNILHAMIVLQQWLNQKLERQDLIQTRAPDESLPTGPHDFLCLCQSYHRTDTPYKLHTPLMKSTQDRWNWHKMQEKGQPNVWYIKHLVRCSTLDITFEYKKYNIFIKHSSIKCKWIIRWDAWKIYNTPPPLSLYFYLIVYIIGIF